MPPTSPFAPAAAPRKLAVIGLGLIGVRYLAAAEADPAFALAAACDLGEATPIDPRAVGVPVYRDHRALLAAHHDLGGAIVTGPGGGRAGLCRDLLAAGLPVCVEHPPATEVSDARALAAIAAERSLVLFAAFPVATTPRCWSWSRPARERRSPGSRCATSRSSVTAAAAVWPIAGRPPSTWSGCSSARRS